MTSTTPTPQDNFQNELDNLIEQIESLDNTSAYQKKESKTIQKGYANHRNPRHPPKGARVWGKYA